MSLSDTLGSIPGYGGYQAARLRNEAQESSDLEQLGKLQSVVANMEKMRQQQQLTANPAQLKDPEFWSRMAILHNKPEYETHAERLRKEQGNAQTMETMRGAPVNTIRPDPQEVAQGADQGTPVPAPVVQRSGGIFDALEQSENPQIAQQAKVLKASMERSGNSVPPQYWQTQQSQLAAKETALLNRPTPQGHVYTTPQGYFRDGPNGPQPVTGPDGKPLMPGSTQEPKLTFGKAAIEAGAERYLIDGTMPPNLGRGNQSSANIAAIQDRAAEMAAERGLTPDQIRQGQLGNKARQQALGQLEKNRNAIQSFEGMLSTNIDVLKDLSKDISRSDSPYANKPILWLKQNAAGDPKVSEYLFQVNTVATEIARILNNPNMTGQLTDSARHELQGVLSGNMNADQLATVIDRAQKDAHNRSASLDKQAAKLNKEMRYWEKPEASPAPGNLAPAAPAPAAPSGWSIRPKGG